ncbi:PREDICTED: G-type lectin S-receptor-like serine/threonine-protein kinase SD2-2 [Nelumbo nucifera]|uniref:Receptor-like serine/threonine-protein kinase n=1 Tax=Nelumbo nucifera TaxID=4432 RepID=A0A1U8B4B8_NELNU|nr:PREDICTED: G-type lectin S-receptor-like serine/threonine-protein kinase SD2-2 [Nelumbo nucifera]
MAQMSLTIVSTNVFIAALLCVLMANQVASSSSLVGLSDNSTLLQTKDKDEIVSGSVKRTVLCKDGGLYKFCCGSQVSLNSVDGCEKGSKPFKTRRRRSNKLHNRYLLREIVDFANERAATSSRSNKLEMEPVIVSGNSTILSRNRTFELGFFSTNGGSDWYIGMWYASIPIRTYVWVANREAPVKNLTSATMRLTEDGRLKITDSDARDVWQTENAEGATKVMLLDTGNLVLLSREGTAVWQSFDFPADTWLPGMNITARVAITSWRSTSDPSPGNYTLRLKSPGYGEFELVFNGSKTYWTTGIWTGSTFSNVPEMMIRYIYSFYFLNPFTPVASFGYTEISLENGSRPPLTRFSVDYSGQLKQYTWSTQTDNWNMFWSRPENRCRAYGLCGNLGVCNSLTLRPCDCLSGFRPLDDRAWNSGDFSGGCRREDESLCDEDDDFQEVGVVSFDDVVSVSFPGSRRSCEESCLKNCSCFGFIHNMKADLCKNLYGNLLNLRNLTTDSSGEEVLYVRVGSEGFKKKGKWRAVALLSSVCGLMAVLGFAVLMLLVLQKRKIRKKKEEEAVFPVTNLKVFSYKELSAATRGFSEKLGHGGFGAVFRGELSDSSLVAVKRLERPGGGEKEFRAEVCTIGNIQHVNLVRLRGFCSENSHRLLVYDYMQNGSLSVFLRRDAQNLSWDVRFRVAVGTARGIAYLHEECRDCIIHCDIKPENILLDSDFTAKVSDFGLAKLIGRDFSRVLTTMRGTWGYVAPEWISGVAITAKADVYSYGMTLLEIIGGRRNVEAPPSDSREKPMEEKWFFPPWAARQIIEGNVAGVMDERLAGAYDPVEAERAAMVAVWCIQDEEAARPTMGMVVKMLEGTVEVTVPPPPKLLQALVSGDSFRGVAITGHGISTAGANSDERMAVSSGD